MVFPGDAPALRRISGLHEEEVAVQVAGLTIVPGVRRLYTATHDLAAWSLTLP